MEGLIYDESQRMNHPERPLLPEKEEKERLRMVELMQEAMRTGELEILENIHQEFRLDLEFHAQIRAALLDFQDLPPGLVLDLRRDPTVWVRQLARRRFPW